MSITVRWIIGIWCFLYAVIILIALKYENSVPIGDLGSINLHALNNAFRGLFQQLNDNCTRHIIPDH